MSFYSFRTLIETNYTIDFKKKKVDVELPSLFKLIISDILSEGLIKTGVAFILLKMITSLFGIEIDDAVTMIALFVLAIGFNISYIVFKNSKLLLRLQLLSEEPLYFWMFWKKGNIKVEKHRQIVIFTYFYFKYKMLFNGECKNKISSIRYMRRSGLKRFIIITFTEPTSGNINFNIRGFVKKVDKLKKEKINDYCFEAMAWGV